MSIDFTPSPHRSLGVEVELGIVDVESRQLVPQANEIISALISQHPGMTEHPKVKQELFLSTIEIITGVCRTAGEAHADLSATLHEVQEFLEPRGLALLGGGVHPFTDPETLRRRPNKRYDDLVNRIQWPARRLQIHGIHFHVGVNDADRAIAILNRSLRYLPLFVALSSSSPYWEGADTGLASVRTKIFESLPTAGLPCRFADWAHYEDYVEIMLDTNGIGSIREIWWDIRPHAQYGTLEFRMSDGTATLREAVALAAMAQCLVQYLDTSLSDGLGPKEPSAWTVRENKWRAARFGLDAQLVGESGKTVDASDAVLELLAVLQPIASELDCEQELGWIEEIVDAGSSSSRQRSMVEQGASLSDVVDRMLLELRTDRIVQ